MAKETTGAAQVPLIHALMPRLMAGIGAIEKGNRNEHQKYQYRSIEDTLAACQSVFVAHGVAVLPNVESHNVSENGTVSVVYSLTFVASDGSSVKASTLVFGKSPMQGFQSAGAVFSYAWKELIFKTFSVPVTQDGDADRGEPAPVAQKPKPAAKAPPKAKAEVTALGIPMGAVVKELSREELLQWPAADLRLLYKHAKAGKQDAYAELVMECGKTVAEGEKREAAGLPM
jgi:hypothetical protein